MGRVCNAPAMVDGPGFRKGLRETTRRSVLLHDPMARRAFPSLRRPARRPAPARGRAPAGTWA
jgi:hypothetical protein